MEQRVRRANESGYVPHKSECVPMKKECYTDVRMNGCRPNNMPWEKDFGNGFSWKQDILLAILALVIMVVCHEFGHLFVFYAFTGYWGHFAYSNGIIYAVYPSVPFPAHPGLCACGGLFLTLPFLLLWKKVGANTKMIIAVQIGYAVLEGLLGVML